MKSKIVRYAVGVVVGAGSALWAAGVLPVRSSADADLLELVKAGTRNAASSIRSGVGTISLRTWSTERGGVSETEIAYKVAFSGERFKLSATHTVLQSSPGPGDEKAKMLIPAGTVLHYTVAYDGSALTVLYADDKAANVLAPDRASGAQPPWWRDISPLRCGFQPVDAPAPGSTVHLPNGGCLLMGTTDAKRQSADGEGYIVVEINQTDRTPGSNNFTSKRIHWVNVDKGFVVAKRFTYGHDDIRTEDVLLDERLVTVRDYGGGRWGPDTCTLVSYRPNKAGEMQRVRIQTIKYGPDFRLNVPVSDADLALTLPAGTKVVDEVHGAEYVIP